MDTATLAPPRCCRSPRAGRPALRAGGPQLGGQPGCSAQRALMLVIDANVAVAACAKDDGFAELGRRAERAAADVIGGLSQPAPGAVQGPRSSPRTPRSCTSALGAAQYSARTCPTSASAPGTSARPAQVETAPRTQPHDSFRQRSAALDYSWLLSLDGVSLLRHPTRLLADKSVVDVFRYGLIRIIDKQRFGLAIVGFFSISTTFFLPSFNLRSRFFRCFR